MPREDVPEELVEMGALVLCTGGHGRHAHEQKDCLALPVYRRQARAVLASVSEAGWVRSHDEDTAALAGVMAERDEARAQSEALAEALEGFCHDGHATRLRRQKGLAVLRAYRSSRESSDAS